MTEAVDPPRSATAPVDAPIFVVGVARSGTTLLAALQSLTAVSLPA